MKLGIGTPFHFVRLFIWSAHATVQQSWVQEAGSWTIGPNIHLNVNQGAYIFLTFFQTQNISDFHLLNIQESSTAGFVLEFEIWRNWSHSLKFRLLFTYYFCNQNLAPASHSRMGHYFFSYLLTWEVELIEILEILAQMWQYVIFLSLKPTKVTSDFILN